MDILRATNLALRFALELGALAAAGYWGATIPGGAFVRGASAVLLPTLVAVFWGVFVSPKAPIPTGRLGRAGLGFLVFLGAAALLWTRGHPTLAIVYGALATISSIVVYALPQ
jgi:hypothetical protein